MPKDYNCIPLLGILLRIAGIYDDFKSYLQNNIMMNRHSDIYATPSVSVVEIEPEGVLASSAGSLDYGGNAFEEGDE